MTLSFKNLFAAGCCALLAGAASASIVTVEVNGTGVDYRAARADALKEALFRVTGVSVSVDEVSHLSLDTSSTTENGESSRKTDISKSQRQVLQEKAGGYIDSYDELDRSKGADGLTNVRFRVSVYRYDMPGMNDTRRSISVLGIDSPVGACFNSKLEGEKISEALTQALMNALQTTRKFAVLDRGSAGLEAEKAFILQEAAGREEAKLGQVRGADYVVSGKVGGFRAVESSRTIKLTGDKLTSRSASLDAQLNLMLLASRQVKFARKVHVKLGDAEIRGLSCNQILDRLSERAAAQMVAPALLSIYPPIVTSVSGDTFTVNYGEGDIAPGSVYGVYSTGDKIYDPYTKESLGRIETLAGKAKAIDVKPKYTVFKLTEGKAEVLRPGVIVRPLASEPRKASAPAKPKQSLKSKMDDAW